MSLWNGQGKEWSRPCILSTFSNTYRSMRDLWKSVCSRAQNIAKWAHQFLSLFPVLAKGTIFYHNCPNQKLTAIADPPCCLLSSPSRPVNFLPVVTMTNYHKLNG
jgi:hypothetical protein